VVERARIVLLAAEGVPGKQIAAMVGCAEPTVVTWQRRYAESGLAGLEDLPRPGKPAQLPEELRDRVLELTLSEPPIQFGATHWSSRLLATALAGEGTPTWVRSAPTPGSRASRRHQEFLAFLKQVAAAYPRRQLHVVVDNLSTHKHPVVRAWLERHPRVQLHFTPTSGSWLNLVEAFFSIITRQALRRGNVPTVADLVAAIERFIDARNDRCRPFTWTKDPDTVIAKATDAAPQDTNDVSYGALVLYRNEDAEAGERRLFRDA
jgi:transposase